MALKDLKKGDKLYAVYNWLGQLDCSDIYECTVKKVITKDFVTRIFLENEGRGTGTRAVGYYLGHCALNENYFFTINDSRLKGVYEKEKGWNRYLDIINARNRLMQLIEEGK